MAQRKITKADTAALIKKWVAIMDEVGHDIGANVYDRLTSHEKPSRKALYHHTGLRWSELKSAYLDNSLDPECEVLELGPGEEKEGMFSDINGNKATIQIYTIDPITETEAIERAGMDPKEWEVTRVKTGGWSTPMKLKKSTVEEGKPLINEQPIAIRNFKILVELQRKTPEVQSLQSLLEQITKHSPKVPRLYGKTKHPKHRRELEINICDPHLGLHCFKDGGANLDWSIEKCEQMILAMMEDLIDGAASYGAFEKIIFPFGNDFMHSDNVFNTTTAGTGQPEADAWHHVYLRAENLAIAMVERFKKVAPVEVITVPGNHDRQSTFTLGRVLDAWYRNDKNVEVQCDASPYKFHPFGVNLIGYEHGHSIQPLRLAALMANETRTTSWAQARYCEWHLGDQHRKGSSKPSMFEEQGVSVEYLPGLTPPNEWSKLKGFNWQKRAGMAFVWDYDRGPLARLQVNINSYTGEILRAA